MTCIQSSAASLLLVSIAASAHAQDSQRTSFSAVQDKGFYGALGVTTYEAETYGADAKLGYNFNRYFGVEAQGVLGLSTDSSPIADFEGAATVSIKPEYTLGAFAVARLPLSERVEIFARGGVHNTRTNIQISNALGTNVDEDKTGFAAGAGLQYNLDPKNGLRAEYTYLDNNESSFGTVDREIVSLSYVRKF